MRAGVGGHTCDRSVELPAFRSGCAYALGVNRARLTQAAAVVALRDRAALYADLLERPV